MLLLEIFMLKGLGATNAFFGVDLKAFLDQIAELLVTLTQYLVNFIERHDLFEVFHHFIAYSVPDASIASE